MLIRQEGRGVKVNNEGRPYRGWANLLRRGRFKIGGPGLSRRSLNAVSRVLCILFLYAQFVFKQAYAVQYDISLIICFYVKGDTTAL